MRRPLVALLALSLSACSLISSLGRAARSGTEVSVVSYNIRHGVGLDDRLSLSRTAAVLDNLDPDIIGLQEVDSMVGRSGRADQAALIAKPVGESETFPANRPERELDHIFVDRNSPWTLGGIEVVPDSVASDHRPVLGWWRLR